MSAEAAQPRKPGRARRMLRDIGLQVAIVLVTLGAIELILRVVDLRFLREGRRPGYTIVHRHDPELGWLPIPHSAAKFVGKRTIDVRHNSLGLRDIEPEPVAKPTILFLGDSFVWGYDAEVDERFTEMLRPQLPAFRLVNAGVNGYGTDQEYLLLNRLWNTFAPSVVVLVFCVDNDRIDNGANARNDGYYKPYLVETSDHGWQFRGQPVPKSRHSYFTDDWLTHHSWLARVAVSAYIQLRHPTIEGPDPTEHLIGMMRDFVTARGAKFLIGVQSREPQLEAFLQAQRIAYTSFDGADSYLVDGNHWTPKGYALVADRLMALFAQTGVAPAPARAR